MATTKKGSKKLTPYQEEVLKAAKQIKEYKIVAEANIVGALYKNPELFYDYKLKGDDFTDNTWRVYWQIANDLIEVEKKSVLDDITVGLYLEKHAKLKKVYEEYGGYDLIDKTKEYVNVNNMDGYIKELYKWKSVLEMIKYTLSTTNRINEFCDMSLDEIYEENEAMINHIFVNAARDIESYNACDGINKYIDELNSGKSVGLPLNNCDILNKEIGGFNCDGNIYGVGANSGVGKSTTVMNYIIPSILKFDEKVVFFINEEDQTKVQREMVIWVANNIFKFDLPKYKLRDGNFDEETMTQLRKVAAEALVKMIKDAKKEGMYLLLNSGYRSYEEQEKIYQETEQKYGGAYAAEYVATPGASEHQTGLGIDMTSQSVVDKQRLVFGDTTEYKWIVENCAKYGFIVRFTEGTDGITGISHEPWHLRYVGKKVAKEIKDQNWTLEEYCLYKNVIPKFKKD